MLLLIRRLTQTHQIIGMTSWSCFIVYLLAVLVLTAYGFHPDIGIYSLSWSIVYLYNHYPDYLHTIFSSIIKMSSPGGMWISSNMTSAFHPMELFKWLLFWLVILCWGISKLLKCLVLMACEFHQTNKMSCPYGMWISSNLMSCPYGIWISSNY